MTGSNEMKLNEATMKEALQYYFENVVFAAGQSPTVVSVDLDKAGYGAKSFTVSLSHSVADEGVR